MLACAGLVPTGPGEAELWFTCLPALARRLPEFLSLAQLTLRHAGDDALVTARVEKGWRPGETLARRCGFIRDVERENLWHWRAQ